MLKGAGTLAAATRATVLGVSVPEPHATVVVAIAIAAATDP